MQAPPGIQVVPDEWKAWKLAMQRIVEHPEVSTLEEYEAWEEKQPKPLTEVLRKYLS